MSEGCQHGVIFLVGGRKAACDGFLTAFPVEPSRGVEGNRLKFPHLFRQLSGGLS